MDLLFKVPQLMEVTFLYGQGHQAWTRSSVIFFLNIIVLKITTFRSLEHEGVGKNTRKLF